MVPLSNTVPVFEFTVLSMKVDLPFPKILSPLLLMTSKIIEFRR